MSLYTRNRESTTDIARPHPCALAVSYWPRRPGLVESEALAKLDKLALDIVGLVEDAYDAIIPTAWS